MREPVRLLAVLAILMGGLFALKSIAFANDATEFFASQAAAATTAVAAVAEEEAYQPEPAPEAEPEAPAEDYAAAAAEACQAESIAASFADRSGITPDEIQLLARLRDRRDEIEREAAELETREAMITAMEARVDGRIEELRGLRDEVQTLLGIVSEREESDLERIVNLYRSMDAKDAAEILAELDQSTQVQVASRMSERSFAPILAEMPRQAAAQLTLALAARSDVPETVDELEARLEQTD